MFNDRNVCQATCIHKVANKHKAMIVKQFFDTLRRLEKNNDEEAAGLLGDVNDDDDDVVGLTVSCC
jgi:hypothetical protein